jgi:hypothetical protein
MKRTLIVAMVVPMVMSMVMAMASLFAASGASAADLPVPGHLIQPGTSTSRAAWSAQQSA